MIAASLGVSCLGVAVSIVLVWYVHRKTKQTISKVSDAILYTFPGVEERKRLLEDIRRTGGVRGEIVERKLGVYAIHWRIPGQEKW